MCGVAAQDARDCSLEAWGYGRGRHREGGEQQQRRHGGDGLGGHRTDGEGVLELRGDQAKHEHDGQREAKAGAAEPASLLVALPIRVAQV